ncbi:GTPase domain-containing protein [Janibacter cremeus]|uniref:GTPase SAR1 family protein n=1 Tax=Janibacter cremeus TaxID=1285192 RepID=A0A852VTB2_9MICO|nr:GTPase domain-containing protein [Janibacter cremeus]NYF99229.1 GTPase SAR1 family protein [Janibacter cremeus]
MGEMTTGPVDLDGMLARVSALRDEVERSDLPLDLASTREARRERAALLDQLDDYVIPRLSSIDAPLLAVVGGSTGAGKSTLINSILRREVSRSGVLRPTTTSPVLIHHPDDEPWFRDGRVLPSLARVTGGDAEPQPGTVRLEPSEDLPSGMAILDAPDIDSVVSANREMAAQLLAAADLWLFVTTAARYADAIPWRLLRQACDRGTAVAIVLDRVDRPGMDEVRSHLIEMLREQGMGTSPVFTVPEAELDAWGFIPEADIARVHGWLTALAGDQKARSIIVRQTLEGALRSLDGRLDALVGATRAQREEVGGLAKVAYDAYDRAEEGVTEGMADGQLLRGEVLARWQEFVGTGEFFRKVEKGVARIRDRVTASVRGPEPTAELDEALQTGVSALLLAEADTAAATVARTWRGTEAGPIVLDEHPGLARSSRGIEEDVERLVRDWQGDVLDIVRSEGANRRTNARVAAYGVNGIGLFLMLVSFAHTGGVLVAPEVAIAGGTTALAQKVLEAIFGDQAVREMAVKARTLLLERVDDLFTGERGRYTEVTGDLTVSEAQIRRLQKAVTAVEEGLR